MSKIKNDNLLLEIALLSLLFLLSFFILFTYHHKKEADKVMFCGGIGAVTCSSGYECKLVDNYPDAGGKCIKLF